MMFEIFEYVIHGTPCEELKVKVIPKITDLDPFQAFTELVKICTAYSSLTHFKLLCYKASEVQLYKSDSLSSFEKHALFSKLVAIKVEWNKVYLSFCSARNSDNQSLEIFVIDKSKQEGVYAKIASHFKENTVLSVVIINAVAMVAYRATKQQIIDGFNMNNSISHITMRQCDIDDKTAQKILQYFSKSRMATAVFIGCTFHNFGNKMMFNGLSYVSTLQILCFDNTNVDEVTAIAISKAIQNNNKLYLIELSNCNLLEKAAITISIALKNISTITTLSFSEKKIPENVADDLVVAIYANCELERLRLAGNNLHQQGAIIATALSQITTLIELDLRNKNMTEKVADELSLAIECNKSLQVLYIGGNGLRTDGIIKISQSISSLSTLRVLEIIDNQITEKASQAMASAISSNTRLEQLYLGKNKLRTGALKIATGLTKNINLKIIKSC